MESNFHWFLCDISKWRFSDTSAARHSATETWYYFKSLLALRNASITKPKERGVCTYEQIKRFLRLSNPGGKVLGDTVDGPGFTLAVESPSACMCREVCHRCLRSASFHKAQWNSGINSGRKQRKNRLTENLMNNLHLYTIFPSVCTTFARSFIFRLQLAFPILLVAGNAVEPLKY